jgi:hypothetical protein
LTQPQRCSGSIFFADTPKNREAQHLVFAFSPNAQQGFDERSAKRRQNVFSFQAVREVSNANFSVGKPHTNFYIPFCHSERSEEPAQHSLLWNIQKT